MDLTIGVALFTLNAEKDLPFSLQPLLQSNLPSKILVVDSSSSDQTVNIAKKFNVEVIIIPKEEFNHGLTREMARKYLNTDIVVMMTPDAYPCDPSFLYHLVQPIVRKEAHIAYARQIPHEGASFLESYPRFFNYPEKSHIRSIQDVKKYGVYTFFCSDSCAAYLNSALDEVHGFPKTNFGEDTIVTALMLQKGKKIAYVAEAKVKHSHRYTLKQEFIRHYQMGQARKEYQTLFALAGSDSQRGKQYFFTLLKKLLFFKPYLLPYAITQTMIKWLGYKLGGKSFILKT